MLDVSACARAGLHGWSLSQRPPFAVAADVSRLKHQESRRVRADSRPLLKFGHFWSRRDRSRLAQGFNLGFPAPETVQVPKGRLKFIPTNIADRIPRGVSSAKPGTPPETSSFDGAPLGS